MYSFIDGDFFESLADFSFGDMYSENIVQPYYPIMKSIFDKFEFPKIFIETHRLGILFKELNNFPNEKCIIIAHNSDATFGKEVVDYLPKCVKKIWCQNYNYIETDTVKSLPIGLERIRWFPEQKKQELLYNAINSDSERSKLVYMNFNPNTNPERLKVFNTLKDQVDHELIGNGGDYTNYLSKLKDYKFIISPPGNGIDCHRNWEALYCGCIPIVLESHFTNNIYGDLPVLIVKSYNNINYEMKNFNTDKIYKEYWKNKIINEHFKSNT